MSVLNHTRAVVRLFVLATSWFACFVVWLPVALMLSPFQEKQRAWRNRWTRTGALAAAWSLNMRLKVVGQPPEAPFCLVSNHLSYLDAVVIMSQIQGVMIAKSEVASWPLIGFLARQIGTVFINRETSRDVVRVNAVIRNLLESGDGIALFPEGTSTEGAQVGRFKSSLLNYPATVSYPVHYACIRYETAAGVARDRVCWWGDMTFADHLYRLAQLPGLTAEVHFGMPPVIGRDRKELTRELQHGVEALFKPVH